MFENCKIKDKEGKTCPFTSDPFVWAKSYAEEAGIALDDKSIGLLAVWFASMYNKGHDWGFTKAKVWNKIESD